MSLYSTVRNIYQQSGLLKKVLWPVAEVRTKYIKGKRAPVEKMLSNMEHRIDGKVLLNVSEFNGQFNFDVRSDLFKRLVIDGSYEPELNECVRERVSKDKDVIDIGANIGLFTVLCATLINDDKKVLAIEPTQRAFTTLTQNIEINEVNQKVVLFNGVASADSQDSVITTVEGREEYSTIGGLNHPSIAMSQNVATETVKSETVDQLIEMNNLNPGFIKIDVEGAEHLVIQGMQTCLSKYRPIVVCELSDYLLRKNGSSAQELIDIVRGYDYDVFDPLSGSRNIGNKEFGDMICIPNKKG